MPTGCEDMGELAAMSPIEDDAPMEVITTGRRLNWNKVVSEPFLQQYQCATS